ncbi:phosphate-binding protein PstS [Citricoccus zhacaiensis]|uniref:Phosphate-binding protein n=1 Tax=Citricoccus zhacaiensis TaxID=489142 RepID=A0ABQ2LU00_9MICC|nr:phosphate ABC transporter substrate-binding protein PstS [Citricoccus zhacaiensis]GGO43189.1 phosphate-binding protein PstS [Citricoccus zhacaiensis]
MKALRIGRYAAVLSVAALALTACGGNGGSSESSAPAGSESGAPAEVSGTLIGGGASSQESAMTAWTNGVTEVHPDLTVQYDPVGSGSGREGFLAGQYSFAGSDAAMDEEEMASAEEICGPEGVFHVPSYISPVAVAFNLEGVDEVNMDAETIAQVFTGEITTWNDPAIADQNPDAELPDTAITVVHRADDSGTTENFTDYLTAAAPESWTYDVVETWPSEITAESAQQTSGVVSLAQSTDGAITYADASQIGDLGTVAVQVGEEYVPYSADAAAAAVEKAEPGEAGAVELDRTTTEAGVYPIVLVSYHIFCNQYQDQETADTAKAFGEYVVSAEGQAAAEASAGNAPISDATRDAALESIQAISVQG